MRSNRSMSQRALGMQLPSELLRTIPNHVYDSSHSFGHQRVENDVNPFRAHYELPKWAKSSDEIGHHYRHPQQTFTHAFNNRMPLLMANRTMADRYKAAQGRQFP